MEADVSIHSFKDEPISVIQDLIAKRARVMNQTTEAATAATAIHVLKSLRANTKSTRPEPTIVDKIDGDMQIEVCECPELVVSFRTQGKQRIPCIRKGSQKGPVATDIKPQWKVGHTRQLYFAKVYRVTLSADRIVAWPKRKTKRVTYVVAHTLEHAKTIAKRRFMKPLKLSTGLAKSLWGRLMVLTSTKPQAVTTNNLGALQSSADVQKISTGFDDGQYTIVERNLLRYADMSLKDGQAAVNTAMMKAANSVNAIINNYIDKHKDDFFSKSPELDKADAPFPPEAFG